jgi:hypothetical protein
MMMPFATVDLQNKAITGGAAESSSEAPSHLTSGLPMVLPVTNRD